MLIHDYEVTPILVDEQEAAQLEERMRAVPNFLGDLSFWELLSRPDSAFFKVDDIGVIGAVNIQQGRYADCHITFWDGRLKGREDLCRETAELFMHTSGLQLLMTAIPPDRKPVLAFAQRVGFEPFEFREGLLKLVLLRPELRNGRR